MQPGSSLKVLTALATLALALSAQTLSAGWQKHLHPESNVSSLRALRDARLVVSQRSDCTLMRLSGQSMLPFFGNNSLAVVRSIAADRLRIGMIAVYRNHLGERVAHRVIEKTEAGWRVQGYNNDKADSTLVVDTNLEGAVYAIFNTSGTTSSNQPLAAHLASLPLALGAPAK